MFLARYSRVLRHRRGQRILQRVSGEEKLEIKEKAVKTALNEKYGRE